MKPSIQLKDISVEISKMNNDELGAYVKCIAIQEEFFGLTERQFKRLEELYPNLSDQFVFNLQTELYENTKVKTLLAKSEKISKINYEEIVEFYHTVCHTLPKIRILSATRKSLINNRIKEFGLETMGEVFTAVSLSDWCNGKNPQNWTATFDWILNATNYAKILEGNFKNKVNENKAATFSNR